MPLHSNLGHRARLYLKKKKQQLQQKQTLFWAIEHPPLHASPSPSLKACDTKSNGKFGGLERERGIHWLALNKISWAFLISYHSFCSVLCSSMSHEHLFWPHRVFSQFTGAYSRSQGIAGLWFNFQMLSWFGAGLKGSCQDLSYLLT